MITYKPVIITSNKRKDGTYPVKIRVTFKQKSRRLPTTLVCSSADLTRSLHIKNPEILRKAGVLIDEMRSVTDTLSPYTMEDWDVDRVVEYIKHALAIKAEGKWSLDFFQYAEEFIAGHREVSRTPYIYAVKTFRKFREDKPTDINEITRKMVLEFYEYCKVEGRHRREDKGVKGLHYISCLSSIYKSAREKYNDEDEGIIRIPRQSFTHLGLPSFIKIGQRNLGIETIQSLIDTPQENEGRRYAVACFLFSFATMGANSADIYTHPPKDGEGWWVYNRKKTEGRRADHAEMRVKLLPPAIYYWEQIKAAGLPSKRFSNCASFNSSLCSLLRSCKGIPHEGEFSFYAARHSWASIARSIGIEKATIDECLAHIGDYQVADIYAERDWDLINKANEKVLALFKWK